MKVAFSLTQSGESWLLRTNLIDGANAKVRELTFDSAVEAAGEILRVVAEQHVPTPEPLPAESPAVIVNPEQGQESPAPVTSHETK